MLSNPGDAATFWVMVAVIILVGAVKAFADSRKR